MRRFVAKDFLFLLSSSVIDQTISELVALCNNYSCPTLELSHGLYFMNLPRNNRCSSI